MLVGAVTGSFVPVPVMAKTQETQIPVSARQVHRVRRNSDGDGSTPVGNSAYEQEFLKIKAAVQKGFYDPKLNGVDWNKVTARYHRELAFLKDRSQFAALMNKMLEELHASHTAYVTNDEAEFYMMNAVGEQDMEHYRVAHIGVMGEQKDKVYIVHAVLDGGPAAKAGLLAGDRLLTADAKPFRSAGPFRGKENTSVQIKFRRNGEDKDRMVSIVPVKENVVRSYLEATRASARIIEVGNRRIGYVHLWTMANDEFKNLLDNLMLTKLHDTDGLILDLRDGYGGHPFGYMDVFSRPDVDWETQYSNRPKTVQHTGYGKPIVALINEGTRSAKEFLSYQLKSSHRATLVGTQTAGAFLGAGFVKIGEEGLLELAEVGLKVDGKRLEQNGVLPDVLVPAKFPYTNQDAQMAQAQDILLKMLPERAPEKNKPAIIHAH